jgi:hypothetical protein
MEFGDTIGDFSDLEDGIYFGVNSFEFAGAVESRNPGAQIIVGQEVPPSLQRLRL